MTIHNEEEPRTNDDSADHSFCILALYKFVSPVVDDDQVVQWKKMVESFLRHTEHFTPNIITGLLLLSVEGVNGTICFPKQYSAKIIDFFVAMYPDLMTRQSFSKTPVFHRLNIKLRPENVTLGPLPHPKNSFLRIHRSGEYVQPGKDWDALLDDPECLVIDTRNEYEVALGSFEGAVQPHTTEFREFPQWLQQRLEVATDPPKKIAMFCTGGIRCEKSTALCLDMLEERDLDIPVYHLKGGILAYLDEVPDNESKFQGECFVFDRRTAVSHRLEPTSDYISCHACRRPVHKKETTLPSYQPGISCPQCFEQRHERRQRYLARQKQFDLKRQGPSSKQQATEDNEYSVS